jgi:hypothetical protein
MSADINYNQLTIEKWFSISMIQLLEDNGMAFYEELKVMNIVYSKLSQNKQREARRLAKQLLKTTAPSQQVDPIAFSKLEREVLDLSSMHTDNLLATPICGDRQGKWWWKVVYQKDNKMCQWGLSEKSPVRSREAAVGDLRELIAKLKAVQLTEPRDSDRSRDRLSLLFIGSSQVGGRLFVRQKSQWIRECSAFLKRLGIDYEEFREESVILYALRTARSIVRHYVNEFEANGKCSPRPIIDSSRKKTDVWNEAASFLMSCDIIAVPKNGDMAEQFHKISRSVVDEFNAKPIRQRRLAA